MADKGVTVEQAMKEPTIIGEYMDMPVTATSIKITNVGDGLSKQLEIAPEILRPGDTVNVLVQCTVGDHTHRLIPKAESWELIQQLKGGTAVIVTDSQNASRLRKAADVVAKADESAKGQDRLDPSMDAEQLEKSNPAEWEDPPSE